MQLWSPYSLLSNLSDFQLSVPVDRASPKGQLKGLIKDSNRKPGGETATSSVRTWHFWHLIDTSCMHTWIDPLHFICWRKGVGQRGKSRSNLHPMELTGTFVSQGPAALQRDSVATKLSHGMGSCIWQATACLHRQGFAWSAATLHTTMAQVLWQTNRSLQVLHDISDSIGSRMFTTLCNFKDIHVDSTCVEN